MNKELKCSIKGCKCEMVLIYLSKPLCEKHWIEECQKEKGL